MHRKIFNTLFVAVFAAMLGVGIITPLMPIYAESLGATGLWLGIIFSGFAVSKLLLLPLIGRLSDRKGRKNFIIFGLLGYTVVSLLYLVADSVFSLTFIRLLHGFASAFIVPVAMAYVGETRKEGQEAASMGTFHIALFLGMGTGPVLGGLLKDIFGFDAAFYAMAILSLFAFFITLFFLPDKRILRKKEEITPFREIFKNNIVKGLLFFRMNLAMGRAGLMVFLPLYGSVLNISASQIGILFAVDTFFNIFFQRFFGKLADKHKKFRFIMAGAVLEGLALMLIPSAHTFYHLIPISAIIGVAAAVSIPSATATTVLLGKKMGMGTLMTYFDAAMSVGFVISPLLLGVVMDLLDINSAFYLAGLIGLSGAFLFYFFTKKETE